MNSAQRASVMLTAEQFAAVEYLLAARGPLDIEPDVLDGALDALCQTRRDNPWVGRATWADAALRWESEPASSSCEGAGL